MFFVSFFKRIFVTKNIIIMKKIFHWVLKNRRLFGFLISVILKAIKKTIKENKKEFDRIEKEINK